MKLIRILKAFLYIITILFVSSLRSVEAYIPILDSSAANNSECDAEQKYISSSSCPCPEDESLASICGIVKSADINIMINSSMKNAAPSYITKNPLSGVTVSIYENVEGIPSGQPFGNLENKLVECVTSETEGKYFCPVRRLNPGNMAYVVYSCNGVVADIKVIPSTRSITGLNSDVSCAGELGYTPLPTVLEYAERDKFLGCQSEPGKPNESITYEDNEVIQYSTQIGEEDGDIRFTPNHPFSLGLDGSFLGKVANFLNLPPFAGADFYGHDGAFWSKDCMVKYNDGTAVVDGVGVPLPKGVNTDPNVQRRREFNLAGGYANVFQKCNYTEEGGAGMEGWDLLTTPYRYDIPKSGIMPTYRVWETRISLQRELQNPRAYQQFNHAMFGDCLGNAHLRYYGEENTTVPISCNELSKCITIGDPKRNVHTTHSFGSRLANPITWEEIITSGMERNQEDVVCRDMDGEYGEVGADITIAEIRPPSSMESCTPGESGCRYKLTSDFYLPQFFITAEGTKKAERTQVIGDSYGSSGIDRTVNIPYETEAEQPHESGSYINYECTGPGKNNCGTTSLRISSDDELFDGTTTNGSKGAMTDRFRSFIDVASDTYDDDYSMTIYEVGGDVKSLCAISSVEQLLTIGSATETDTKINNTFIGNKKDHSSSETAGAATYATEEAIERDAALAEKSTPDAIARDTFDSLQRYSSGDGKLEFLKDIVTAFYQSITKESGEVVKSFGDRVLEKDWNPDTPATVNTKFCISEKDFKGDSGAFPPYKSGGYPGSAEGCYPWNPLAPGEYCNVWPGPGNNPVGEIRTCKVNECAKGWEFRENCLEEICAIYFTDPRTGRAVGEDCSCSSFGPPTIVKVNCSDGDITECLRRQEDNYPKDSNAVKQRRSKYEVTSDGSVPSGSPFCDLSVAGPMIDPGDIGGDRGFSQGARTAIEPFGPEEHYNMDSVSASGNDTLRRWQSPITVPTAYLVGALSDYNTTNPKGAPNTGNAGQKTAGMLTRGEGFGGVSVQTDIVSNPLNSSSLVEDYEVCDENTQDIHCWECNPLTAGDEEWCKRIPPPGEVDLRSIDGGACKPEIGRKCPLWDEDIGSLALDIIGAAGEHAGGVPGSVILAAIVGEVDWLAKYDKVKDPETGNIIYVRGEDNMKWDDISIASYSSPWYARVPKCNDTMPTAQGPFGLLDSTFEGSVVGNKYASFDDIGFHPSRLNSLGLIYTTYGSGKDAYKKPIVSKCNFIDAAYAAAPTLKSPAYDCSTTDLSGFEDEIKKELAGYRGMDVSNSTLDYLVDIAINCQ